jgi:hypothetical protein
MSKDFEPLSDIIFRSFLRSAEWIFRRPASRKSHQHNDSVWATDLVATAGD